MRLQPHSCLCRLETFNCLKKTQLSTLGSRMISWSLFTCQKLQQLTWFNKFYSTRLKKVARTNQTTWYLSSVSSQPICSSIQIMCRQVTTLTGESKRLFFSQLVTWLKLLVFIKTLLVILSPCLRHMSCLTSHHPIHCSRVGPVGFMENLVTTSSQILNMSSKRLMEFTKVCSLNRCPSSSKLHFPLENCWVMTLLSHFWSLLLLIFSRSTLN